jgi:hypothetical protein
VTWRTLDLATYRPLSSPLIKIVTPLSPEFVVIYFKVLTKGPLFVVCAHHKLAVTCDQHHLLAMVFSL